MKDFPDYELIDCGNEKRIERFGQNIIERPCPQADWPLNLDSHPKTEAVFWKHGGKSGWEKPENSSSFAEASDDKPENWPIRVGSNQAELRFSAHGQVGIFPEQAENWQWIEKKIEQTNDRELKILNAFAYTGIATLFASTENTEVCHLDGAKSAINWAKRNAELSGKSDHKIRWICDDVLEFMAREVRRGKTYDAIILDPPAFGRAGKKNWKIERDLSRLLQLTEQLLSKNPLFVILTCHAPEHFSAENFANLLEKFPQFDGKEAETLELTIASENGNSLTPSFGARICQ